MPNEWRSPTPAQRERLLYLLTQCRIEAPSDGLRNAYWRLELALTKRVSVTPGLAILDWLAAELEILKGTQALAGETTTVLLEQAKEFCEALKA